MKSFFFILISLLTLTTISIAQDQEIKVTSAINGLFEKVNTSDTSGMRDLFANELNLKTLFETKSGIKTEDHKLEDWLKAVAGTKAGELKEVSDHIEVDIDHYMAHAWVPYEFYYKGEFLHCGTNSFLLILDQEEWKISSITDTRLEKCDKLKVETKDLDSLINQWHHAASTADEDTFFSFLKPDGIYIGTDASERWEAEEMEVWAKEYFQGDTAWHFTTIERNWDIDKDQKTAWFDELLDTWMGVCRASGVVQKHNNGEWKLKHYHLSITIPNDKLKAVIKACE